MAMLHTVAVLEKYRGKVHMEIEHTVLTVEF